MRSRRAVALLLLALTGHAVLASRCCAGPPTACASVAVDTTLADTTALFYLGGAYGQVVAVAETLVSSFTVYRAPSDAVNRQPMQFMLTEVDSTGKPAWADIVFSGPSQAFPDGDGVHSVPCRFDFSPPVTLPHSGRFCFLVRDATCSWLWSLLANTHDPYGQGGAWQFPRNFECALFPPSSLVPALDLAFALEFCGSATPIRRTSWGSLKQHYR